MRLIAAALLFLTSCASLDTAPALDPARFANVDRVINDAIAQQKTPGGVLWVEHDGAVYTRAYGQRATTPVAEATSEETVYDAASITKVIATAPSIWLLVQRGKVALDTPVQTYLPEFTEPAITVRHLMTHSSGLRPSLDLRGDWKGYDEGIKRALAETPRNRPGAIFRYSDINYILLGEIVRRVSGETLDVFAKREIFEPLGMSDTGFRPVASPCAQRSDCKEYEARIAPTERSEGVILRGVVHDPTSRRMGGVAGHAGLFTTARDLAKFARMFMTQSDPEVRMVELPFTPETLRQMASVQSPREVAIRRAGGFDVDSHYAKPRGDYFPIGSFGHTGWTGGFLWIDPLSRTFYVFLSNRVHPEGKGSVVALQSRLGTAVAEVFGGAALTNVAGALPVRAGGRVNWVFGGGEAQNGIDVLHASGYDALRGLRVGLITNHTGIDRIGNPTIDLLRSAPGVQLVALFSPEHGIRGTLDQENVGDMRDEITGLPIFSLYAGDRRKPLPAQVENLDALVFDIQDIGTRFYTYISTMGLAMEAAAESKKKFIVLDRVNAIGADVVAGPVREGESSMVAWHTIPVQHGMTVGELARMFNEERGINADLTVVQVKGWKREQWQDEAGLPWINTSPNMRSQNAAALYPGIGLMESALSVGRGTNSPFELFGAPYIDSAQLLREVEALKLPGLAFAPVSFTPTTSIFKDELCHGLRVTITDRRALRAVEAGVAIASTLSRLYGEKFAVDKMERLLRHKATLDAIRRGASLNDIRAQWDTEAFIARRAKYLLY